MVLTDLPKVIIDVPHARYNGKSCDTGGFTLLYRANIEV
jgi:predicted nucleic-acid-binding Zn-ribbon protein